MGEFLATGFVKDSVQCSIVVVVVVLVVTVVVVVVEVRFVLRLLFELEYILG